MTATTADFNNGEWREGDRGRGRLVGDLPRRGKLDSLVNEQDPWNEA